MTLCDFDANLYLMGNNLKIAIPCRLAERNNEETSSMVFASSSGSAEKFSIVNLRSSAIDPESTPYVRRETRSFWFGSGLNALAFKGFSHLIQISRCRSRSLVLILNCRINFFAMDLGFFRRLNAETDLLALDLYYCDLNVIVDGDAFAKLPC
jgi:hypothetical protein